MARYFNSFHHAHIEAAGDIDVDPHHLVEDIGLVLGDAFTTLRDGSPLARFGNAVIPMDEALSEVVLDAAGRPYLVYQAAYPQSHAGTFDLSLIREFLFALTMKGGMNLHAHCRYGENGHHMVESLFKALGKALGMAYTPLGEIGPLSTKGTLY